MKLFGLVLKEIAHRKLSFITGFAAVMIASGIIVSQMMLLYAHDSETGKILASKQEELGKKMWVMEDDYRKIMKELGFNVVIFSSSQKLDQYWADGNLPYYMPEKYIDILAADTTLTIRHLLPVVQEKIMWPEKNMSIILIGTRGEMKGPESKEPILTLVPPGEIVLGYELWKGLGLEKGDRITLMGENFSVSECHSQRGSKDDISAWINLAAAQEMLGKKGKINAILALKCLCAGADLPSIRKDISRLLPNTQVIEFEDKAVTRELARTRAKTVADSMFHAEAALQADIHNQKEKFASFLIPLVIAAGTALIFLLSFSNVRTRKEEIGTLAAIGFESGKILKVFIAKAAILGLTGSVAGFMAGLFFGVVIGAIDIISIRSLGLFVSVVTGSVIFAVLASYIPAVSASLQDPAAVLRGE